MSQNWSANNGNSGGSIKIQNFLEALRNSQNASAGSFGQEPTESKTPFAEIKAKKEVESARIKQFQQQRNQEWNKVFSSKETQIEKRLIYIREQLVTLSKQLKRLDKNIVKAVEAPVVTAGEYQESFLNHLHSVLRLFSLKVSSANTWLELYQSRAAKQGVYWGMAKKRGSSYTQNNERAIATSVG